MWLVKTVKDNLINISPKQGRQNEEAINNEEAKSIGTFLNKHFNDMADLSELKSINFHDLIYSTSTTSSVFLSAPQLILWFSRSIKTKLDEALEKTIPSTGLKQFLEISTLILSNLHLIVNDIKVLSNCLRNSTTIKEVYLDNCGINDEQVKVLADIFRSNKTITKLSLSGNKEITGIGIKTLLNINNEALKNVVVHSLNIFDPENQKEIPSQFVNKNLQNLRSDSPISKSAKANLDSIAENYNEITGKGTTDNLFVVLGLPGSGRTVTAYGLSGLIKLAANDTHQVEAKNQTHNSEIQHHKQNSKITEENDLRKVNNFRTFDEKTKIIEFPAIGGLTNNISGNQNDINIFSDAYSWWQIFRSGKSIKFLIILNGSLQNGFISTIKPFVEIFKNKENKLDIDLKKVPLLFL